MKHLIIFADPNPKGFCREIVKVLEETLSAADKDVIVRDLYELKFDPILSEADMLIISKDDYMADVKEEQELIQDAAVVTFVYPIWWLGPPAILKGYFDRVLSRGFAYSIGKQGFERGLEGKKAVVINVMGAKKENYEQKGLIDAMNKVIDKGILQYVGFEVIEHLYLGEIMEDELRDGYLDEVRRLGQEMAVVGIKSETDIW